MNHATGNGKDLEGDLNTENLGRLQIDNQANIAGAFRRQFMQWATLDQTIHIFCKFFPLFCRVRLKNHKGALFCQSGNPGNDGDALIGCQINYQGELLEQAEAVGAIDATCPIRHFVEQF